ncbi:MAG: NUDIX hydrolase [Candidatus Protochlamydia sp.]|nr:NUDIX hydrolase [Candidatus Protochlamydia sp.]
MNSEIFVYNKKPKDFYPKVEVAAIYLNVNDKLLLLELSADKQEKGAWGVPAGKLEIDERPSQAAKRDLLEETGIDIEAESSFHSLGELYIRKPEIDYTYHLFVINLESSPAISLSSEHCSYRWVSRFEAESLPLMNGAKLALDTYFQRSTKKHRSGASVNVYLILMKDADVLLHLRQNTGYLDNYYGLIAGHVEDGESATDAIIREAYEEAGIEIEPSALKAVHVMHRQTNRLNIDVFFESCEFKGQVTNKEPEKCEALNYFPLKHLPINTIYYIQIALQAIGEKNFYSEHGWHQ